MTDFDLNPAQSGILDELNAEPISQTAEGVLAKKPDGSKVEVTPEGEVRTLPDDAPPGSATETIDGEAEEIPLEEPPGPVEFTPEEAAAAIAEIPPESLAVDVRDPDSLYRVMDRNDELLILEEIQGNALDTFVYSFERGGKLLTDLTISGVNETVRLMNERGATKIGIAKEVQPVLDRFERDNEDYVNVLVYAEDTRLPGSGRWGTATEPEKPYGGWDKFAFTKALNKAQRNALKMQIPETFRQTIIAQYLGTHHVKELKPLQVMGTADLAELPPPVTDEKAQALKVEIQERYTELRGLNQMKLPPARYRYKLERAEASHHDLETFRDSIQEAIDAELKRKEAS